MAGSIAHRLPSFQRRNLRIEYVGLKYACPENVYVSVSPDDPALWFGVLFVRKGTTAQIPLYYESSVVADREWSLSTPAVRLEEKETRPADVSATQGPYSPSVLRFQISFPSAYPRRAPVVTITTDIFHPLTTPLTTYTHSTENVADEPVSATDDERLPPGGFSLRHGFPHSFGRQAGLDDVGVVDVLNYMRRAFEDETLLDQIPLEDAANKGAWHAWRSHRARRNKPSVSPLMTPSLTPATATSTGTSTPVRHQSGVARRPGEWDWQGVWEERVRKGIRASVSEHVLYGGGETGDDLIRFLDMDPELLEKEAS
ncbi:hypothetical protein LTR50_001765 [Elasticomyces elasticus]|nr:hypothetical protein LTR50_001765 [Elasticomyces elasticus]